MTNEPRAQSVNPAAPRTLELIAQLQPQAVAYIRQYGFVLDKAGPITDDTDELTRWKVLAFSLYSDVVEASTAAERLIESGVANAPAPLDVERLQRLTRALEAVRDTSTDRASRQLAASMIAMLEGGAAPERLPPEPPLASVTYNVSGQAVPESIVTNRESGQSDRPGAGD